MDKPIIDLDHMVNRDSCDPRAQGRFLTLLKQACLNFKSTPIKYRQSFYHQTDLMDINQQILLELQKTLSLKGDLGDQDKVYDSHEEN